MTKKNSKIITLVCVVAFVVLCAYLISVGTAPGKTDCPSPETIDKQFNTPFGRVELESNYDAPNSIDARISPNYYVQALLNMLGR